MVAEVTVTLKNEEAKISKKYLVYETFTIAESDPTIETCVKSTKESFNGEAETVSIKIKLLTN